MNNTRSLFRILFGLILLAIAMPLVASAQKRDNLTDEEDMLVREAQELDKRIGIFVKVIDRRLLVISNPAATEPKPDKKDKGDWGPLRTGTKQEMLFDIQKSLNEAIAKIDDVAERDQKNELFPKAVRILAEACRKWLPQFQSIQQNVTVEKEKEYIFNAIEFANQVIEASAKVPAEEKKKKN